MVLEELAWKTRPGACEDDPPVAGSGPWSTTVTSVQPRAEISSASAAPTTPAPMMTTRGPAIAAPPVKLLCTQHDSGCATQCARRADGCQEAGDGTEQAGKRQRPADGAQECAPPTGRPRADYLIQASTLARLASTHFLAAASGVILSTAMYLATVFWSSFVQLNFFTRS